MICLFISKNEYLNQSKEIKTINIKNIKRMLELPNQCKWLTQINNTI